MDLGIAGRKAIVCAASRGLGRSVAEALAAEGVALVINGRDRDALDATARHLRCSYRVPVAAVVGDITTETGRRDVIAAACDADILITNAGGPPPGDFLDADAEAWRDAFEANMLTPLLLIRSLVGGMAERGFGRIVNITTAGVQSPASYPQLPVSVGVRTGLTGAVAALARQVAAHGVTINGLLPGRFLTDRLRGNLAHVAERAGTNLEVEMAKAESAIPAARFGRPEEFGAVCAFLCSRQAGYLTGRNIVLDGGAFPGLF
jgi:3-oxoacyl-[acyl-carrier protein] reductase